LKDVAVSSLDQLHVPLFTGQEGPVALPGMVGFLLNRNNPVKKPMTKTPMKTELKIIIVFLFIFVIFVDKLHKLFLYR